MSGRTRYDDYPTWVKLTIKPSTSRRAAWFWFFLSAAFGLIGIAFILMQIGFFAPLIAAIGGPIVAVLYLLSIKWVDRNAEWPS